MSDHVEGAVYGLGCWNGISEFRIDDGKGWLQRASENSGFLMKVPIGHHGVRIRLRACCCHCRDAHQGYGMVVFFSRLSRAFVSIVPRAAFIFAEEGDALGGIHDASAA